MSQCKINNSVENNSGGNWFFFPKEGQNRGKPNYLKTFGFWLNPPPLFGQSPKERHFFLPLVLVVLLKRLKSTYLVFFRRLVQMYKTHRLKWTASNELTMFHKLLMLKWTMIQYIPFFTVTFALEIHFHSEKKPLLHPSTVLE